jgi:uncharacterized protein
LAEKNEREERVESRGVESALPHDYHLNDIDVRYARVYVRARAHEWQDTLREK